METKSSIGRVALRVEEITAVKIDHCLIANPGIGMKDIRTVYSHLIKGYVESEEHGGTYFGVKMRLSKGNDIAESRCTCTSAHFYGNPCSHALTMRNVYVKHKKELKKEVRK